MKTVYSILLVGVAMGMVVPSSAENVALEQKPRSVMASELKKGTAVIIGELGLPLITAVEVIAMVEEVPWSYLILGGDSSPGGRYLLRVEEVDGKKLEKPKSLPFVLCQAWNVSVAPDKDALDKLLRELVSEANGGDLQEGFNPQKKFYYPKIQNEAEAAAYKQIYVGSRHRLVVFEIAFFDGMPRNLPPEVGSWQPDAAARTFRLCVLAERKL